LQSKLAALVHDEYASESTSKETSPWGSELKRRPNFRDDVVLDALDILADNYEGSRLRSDLRAVNTASKVSNQGG